MSCKVNTRKGSERIVRAAYEFARKFGRRKVTVVHKANVVRATDGLFLEVASSPKRLSCGKMPARQTAKMAALRYYSAFFGAAAASVSGSTLLTSTFNLPSSNRRMPRSRIRVCAQRNS